VKNFKTFYRNKRRCFRFSSKLLLAGLFTCLCYFITNAQNCPPNIDFETGGFNGWTCYTGYVAAVNGENVITLSPSGPVPGRHTMYAANSGLLDAFGGFPVNCPNGSGYSIRLGNDLPGTEAEGVSYEFTIPANRNVYSLIYHYAVVFQDPNHEQYQQPRMEIEITNVTDNKIIDCSSFTFIPYGSLLPGFFESPNPGSSTPVWCKDWSAVSINLNGNAGKTIKLFFKTADCTFRRHFGYAYIDVNSECSDEFVGATYCRDDTSVNVTAPFGYQGYTWYNNGFTQVLGTQQTLKFPSPPAAGTTIAVKVVPYNGYGCEDTLYARLIDTLTVTANAGKDTFSCNHNPVLIGANTKPGLVYNWTPAAGLNNPSISNPLASPDLTTTYVLTTRHDGGGCVDTDTVIVKAAVIDSSLQLLGKTLYCFGSGDSTILIAEPSDSIQWFRNNIAINGAHQTQYKVTKSGSYHALLFNKTGGCSIATRDQGVVIDIAKPGVNYPIQYAVVDLPIRLQARQFGATALWNPTKNLDNPASYSPTFQSSVDQLYTIEIKTNSGCVTVDTQLVKIVPHVDMYVPTAFTPNNDGLNDFLRPTLMGVKELHYFRIYNRWGQLLFETKTDRPGWNGNFNGMTQPTQVVVWIAEGIGVDGRTYTRKGTSTLVR
jgi:gliding motility-associated-like protein